MSSDRMEAYRLQETLEDDISSRFIESFYESVPDLPHREENNLNEDALIESYNNKIKENLQEIRLAKKQNRILVAKLKEMTNQKSALVQSIRQNILPSNLQGQKEYLRELDEQRSKIRTLLESCGIEIEDSETKNALENIQPHDDVTYNQNVHIKEKYELFNEFYKSVKPRQRQDEMEQDSIVSSQLQQSLQDKHLIECEFEENVQLLNNLQNDYIKIIDKYKNEIKQCLTKGDQQTKQIRSLNQINSELQMRLLGTQQCVTNYERKNKRIERRILFYSQHLDQLKKEKEEILKEKMSSIKSNGSQ